MSVTLFKRNQAKGNPLPLDVGFMTFSGGERHVQLGNFVDCSDYIIRANLRTSEDIVDLLLLANALNEKFESSRLFVEIPYLPYARQDRVCSPGQAFSLKVLAGLLAQVENVEQLVTWDCHSSIGTELTGARNIAAEDIIKTHSGLANEIIDLGSVIICPDKGAVARTQAIAMAFEKDLQPHPIVYCEKVRDPATGQITHTDVKVDNLSGQTAIITDDICDGGYTFIKVAEQLKEKGAERIILFVTHGIFSKGLDVFDGLIDEIFTTTSFDHAADPRLKVIPYEFKF